MWYEGEQEHILIMLSIILDFFKVCNSFSHMYDLGKSVSQFPVTDVDVYVRTCKWIELDQSAQIWAAKLSLSTRFCNSGSEI